MKPFMSAINLQYVITNKQSPVDITEQIQYKSWYYSDFTKKWPTKSGFFNTRSSILAIFLIAHEVI